MSNEYKDYIYDMVCETVLDYGAVDQIKQVIDTNILERKYVFGEKNGQKVVLLVYLDNEGNWIFEHR